MQLLEWVLAGIGAWTALSVATGLLLGPVLRRASADTIPLRADASREQPDIALAA